MINSSLNHLHVFIFGSMLHLFCELYAEVMQEAVCDLCVETNTHNSLYYSKYCKLCYTLRMLQNKLSTVAFVPAIREFMIHDAAGDDALERLGN